MEYVFPVVCFCIARHMLTTLNVNAKESLEENAASQLAFASKPLSLGAIPAAG